MSSPWVLPLDDWDSYFSRVDPDVSAVVGLHPVTKSIWESTKAISRAGKRLREFSDRWGGREHRRAMNPSAYTDFGYVSTYGKNWLGFTTEDRRYFKSPEEYDSYVPKGDEVISPGQYQLDEAKNFREAYEEGGLESDEPEKHVQSLWTGRFHTNPEWLKWKAANPKRFMRQEYLPKYEAMQRKSLNSTPVVSGYDDLIMFSKKLKPPAKRRRRQKFFSS